MPVQEERLRDGDEFEEEAFRFLCRALNSLPNHYTVTSPLYIHNREIDGLVISPSCVFTLELKAIKGAIHMDMNSPLTAYNMAGKKIEELSNRHMDSYKQADNQWKSLSKYFSDTFNVDNIFVKSILVFKPGSTFHVYENTRDFSDYKVPVFIASLDEVPAIVRQFVPDIDHRRLDSKVHQAIVKSLRGPNKVTDTDRQLVAQAPVVTKFAPRPPAPTVQKPGTTPPLTREQKPASPIPLPTPIRRERPFFRSFFLTALAFLTFFVWIDLRISLVLAALLFWGLYQRWRLRSVYLWIGGLFYGCATSVLSITGVTAILIAVLWPVTLGLGIWSSITGEDTPILGIEGDTIRTVESMVAPESSSPITPAVFEDEAFEDEATEKPPDSSNPQEKQIRVRDASHVRAGPGEENTIIGTAPKDAVYTVLEENAEGTWLKIRLETGIEGWIGSSRVTNFP